MFTLNESACREIGRSAALRMWVYAEDDPPNLVAILYDLEPTVRQFLEARDWTVDTGDQTISSLLAAATEAGAKLLEVLEAESADRDARAFHGMLDSGTVVEIAASDGVLNTLPTRVGWRRASKVFRDEARSRLGDDDRLVGLAEAESLGGGKDAVVCLSEKGVYYFGAIKRGPEIEVPLMGEFAADRP
jgi:hypothetical protein